MLINLNLSEIKKIIGINSSKDDMFTIKKISSLESATSDDIAFLFDRGSESIFPSVSLDIIKKSDAGIIVAEKEVVPGKKYLIVKDALSAFSKIVNFIQRDKSERFISEMAFISNKSNLHKSVRVGHFSVICEGTTIDELTFLDSNVFIGKDVSIGKNVKIYSGAKILDGSVIGSNSIIHANVVIGSDGFGYSVTKHGLQKIPQIGVVEVGDNVEIGACTTIDRAAFAKTVIGDGCKIDNLVMIAHNVIIGSHSVILAQTGIAGSVVIGDNCQIGGQVAIKDHVKIGNGAKVVSKSGVMKDVKTGEIVAGIPALPFSKWKRAMIVFSMLPEYLRKIKSEKNRFGFIKRLFGNFF